MTLTTGVISLVSKTSVQAVLSCTAATGGTGPYTYQWYRSTTSGFSPGGGNILSGKTSLSLTDTGLIPGTQYYYKLVSTDTGNSNITVTAVQLGVLTDNPAQSQNAFSQSPQVGMTDLRMNVATLSAEIDVSETGSLVAGQAVKIVDSAGGVPKVVACSANADEVLGFINYDVKSRAFVAGDACELSLSGNVMYLYATGAIARGIQVQLDVSTKGGVAAISGSSGADIVGFALDKASAGGQLIRVRLGVPSFAKA